LLETPKDARLPKKRSALGVKSVPIKRPLI